MLATAASTCVAGLARPGHTMARCTSVQLVVLLVLCGSLANAANLGSKQAFILDSEGIPDNAMPVSSGSSDEDAAPYVIQVGLHPKAYLYKNFLTHEERVHMLRLAAPEMKRSTVVGSNGSGVVDDIRTSYGMFIRRLHDPIIERIEQRISLVTHLPIAHQEDIQVLRYQKTQTYGAHYDSSYDRAGVGPKQRLATFLMYLSDVEEGGETAFPKDSVWYDPSLATKQGTPSECAKGHVFAKPRAGDAVLFYSYHPNGTMDTASMHTGCPVIKGIKWASPVWIHINEFNPPLRRPTESETRVRDPGMCDDYHDQCHEWASSGECTKNPGFMTGAGSVGAGTCRKSCKVCEQCSANDWTCINKNRKAGGFLELQKEEMDWLGVEWWHYDEPPSEL